MVKHQPVTPLPWNGERVVLRGENAPHISHAVNAYPRLVALAHKILERIEPPHTGRRIERQVAIEQAITQHRPDPSEAQDIVIALAVALQERYGERALEVALYASLLSEALERLDAGREVQP